MAADTRLLIVIAGCLVPCAVWLLIPLIDRACKRWDTLCAWFECTLVCYALMAVFADDLEH